MNFIEARQFFKDKIEFYQNEVVEVYNYIKCIDDLIYFIYESEPDTSSRKSKLDYFRRLRHDRELAGLKCMQNIVEYQELLISLYETTFVFGHEYYFF